MLPIVMSKRSLKRNRQFLIYNFDHYCIIGIRCTETVCSNSKLKDGKVEQYNMFAIIWLVLGIVPKWIVLRKSNLPGVFAAVPLLGNFFLARSAGRTDIGVIRMLSAIAVSLNLFLVFAAAGKYHFPVSDAAIGFIEQNILYRTSFQCVDVLIFILLVFVCIYLAMSVSSSFIISNNWGFHWAFVVVLFLLEPVGLSIMAFGNHKPLVRYV